VTEDAVGGIVACSAGVLVCGVVAPASSCRSVDTFLFPLRWLVSLRVALSTGSVFHGRMYGEEVVTAMVTETISWSCCFHSRIARLLTKTSLEASFDIVLESECKATASSRSCMHKQ